MNYLEKQFRDAKDNYNYFFVKLIFVDYFICSNRFFFNEDNLIAFLVFPFGLYT